MVDKVEELFDDPYEDEDDFYLDEDDETRWEDEGGLQIPGVPLEEDDDLQE